MDSLGADGAFLSGMDCQGMFRSGSHGRMIGGDTLRKKRTPKEPDYYINRSEAIWRIGNILAEMARDCPEIDGVKLFVAKDATNAVYKAIYGVPKIVLDIGTTSVANAYTAK